MPFTDEQLGFGNGCGDTDTIQIPIIENCESTPTGWSLLEVGSEGTGALSYGGGTVSAFGDDFSFNGLPPSYAPPSYEYTGYMRLTVSCSDGSSSIVDSWETLRGSPSRNFNHSYSNPCCPTTDSGNTKITWATIIIPGVGPLGKATRILHEFNKLAGEGGKNGFGKILIDAMKSAGATFTNSGKLLTPPTTMYPPGTIANPGLEKSFLDMLRKAIENAGGKITPPGGGGGSTPGIFPMVIPLPLMPGWNPATGNFDDGWQGACNDPGTLNPGVGTAIASIGGPAAGINTAFNLSNVYGSAAIPSLSSNNHVIQAFGGVPPATFPTILVAKG